MVANEAASILLGNGVTQVTPNLPIQAAKDLGINQSALEIYAGLEPK